jgi:hypothetical protein
LIWKSNFLEENERRERVRWVPRPRPVGSEAWLKTRFAMCLRLTGGCLVAAHGLPSWTFLFGLFGVRVRLCFAGWLASCLSSGLVANTAI